MVLEELPAFFLPALVGAVIWELIWKGIALWKTARSKQVTWYIAILVFNTVGLLPIIYLLFFKKKPLINPVIKTEKKSKKKK